MSASARRDRRWLGLVLTAVVVLLGGAWFAWLEPTHPAESPVQEAGELRRRFDAAVLLLHSRQFSDAQASLQRVIELAPQLPEAHANMGFALLGLQQAEPARGAFERAIALKADQANAYYGLALAHEAGGDLELALGAMRSYLHLARGESEAHLRRARAAVWEWETQIGQRRASGKP
ncbi:MAG TPA: tetratricopeptide repeat protein [Piscinibacter sp.]|nr:hypothetical protein [Piscinibacter sp.]HOY35411.1 tetratricopeptide repeat protein [Piscinibacter sp.]HPG77402.1 tetratricopeptide repeat protein [Piscinibacter sp.]HPM64725.1 tetratricopeptide repeat protein [Piscinibacter sp.]